MRPRKLLAHRREIHKLDPATGTAPRADALAATASGTGNSLFAGKVTLVNVWASWCAPCRQEHPLLMQLAKDENLVIAGLNYKDKPAQANRAFAHFRF